MIPCPAPRAWAAALVATAALARAEEPDPEPSYSSTVKAEKNYSTASAATVRDRDLLLAPRHSPTDVLRTAPGLVLAQHQGGGKADQLFLRGFDADHGTDVALSFDGVPVNLVSHAHGQGYADLHFVIPELIERLEVTKGPYFADQGDFATAGAVNLVTRDEVERASVGFSAGSFDTARLVALASPSQGDLRTLVAAEAYTTQGPFVLSEDLRRYNLFAKASFDLDPRTRLTLTGSAYGSQWRASGQIPARLVDAGRLDRFGFLDPSEGGVTHREQATLSMERRDADARTTATLSALRYGLQLFSNFTFQARDPVRGDAIEQDDERVMLYADVRSSRRTRTPFLPGVFTHTLGASLRHDTIETGLWHVQQRVRLSDCFAEANPCVLATVAQTSGAMFLQEDWRISRAWRLVAGLRYDRFRFGVEGRAPVQVGQWSPKASVVWSPSDNVSLFANTGRGFHSNDAKGVADDGAGALAPALGYELGTRTKWLGNRLEIAAALWGIDLSSELVWSGDEGTTEAAGASRRMGVEVEGRWQPAPWLFADLDVTLARGGFESGRAIPLAPRVVVTGGLMARHPAGVSASLRLRHVGDRPATEDTTDEGAPACAPSMNASDTALTCALIAQGYTVIDARITYESSAWAISLLAENLTNAAFREAQFATDTRVTSVGETHPVRDVHFTPGNPLSAQLAVTALF